MKRIPQTPSRRPNRPRHRVLYVEDNDDNWNVIEYRIGGTYELVRAANDREACEILSRPSDWYAILMDVELSGSQLNGIQLTKLIRGRLPLEERPSYAHQVPVLDTPLLFVTAYAHAYPNPELIGAGADAVLPKPIDFTRLNVALTKLFVSRTLTRT